MGIGSFMMPLFGMQFRLFNLFGEGSQPGVGILMAVGVEFYFSLA
jgi:hypothetical protein